MTISNHLFIKPVKLAFVTVSLMFFTSGFAFSQGFYGAWEDANRFIIFLDPGHGGQELGSRGATSMLEKNITLKLANLIKKRLSRDERLEVRSSRIDDIDLSVVERINMANSMRANLFVGIHTDGGITPRFLPMRIFVWGPDENIELGEDNEGVEKQEGDDRWDNLQYKKEEQSLELGSAMESRLAQLNPERGVHIIATDRMLIGGLTMPAILVEPIDLSNPQDEIKLQDMKYLKEVANAITDAIYDYLKASESWE